MSNVSEKGSKLSKFLKTKGSNIIKKSMEINRYNQSNMYSDYTYRLSAGGWNLDNSMFGLRNQ